MLLSSPFFVKHPSSPKPHPSPFLHGSFSLLLKLPSSSSSSSYLPPPSSVSIQAVKKMQGRVVCATNDKTVSVEVVRLAPHPKYKRRIRKKKKFQAHDPENQFKVGDVVQLERSRPISKTKAFVAVPVLSRHGPKTAESVAPSLLDLPLQSQEQPAA
ncbi:30S ribosomal protein S17, chloroplastic [Apostasia shenzhenica]|uniref:Small ribosomal subunit protein uS17c n=1 Tax=Apostasia shenzhenica TaxID=1088818 RepID=A0A2I0BB51_9ASPA|nr:30S ribosomal protein S17, chloroplastic [Apostasia shenzhenica]